MKFVYRIENNMGEGIYRAANPPAGFGYGRSTARTPTPLDDEGLYEWRERYYGNPHWVFGFPTRDHLKRWFSRPGFSAYIWEQGQFGLSVYLADRYYLSQYQAVFYRATAILMIRYSAEWEVVHVRE